MSAQMRSPSDLNRVVEELLPRLCNTAYYLTGDSHRAEDLAQETIAMLLESFRKDPSRIRNPLAWCMRVLARVSWKKRPLTENAVLDDLATDRPGPETTVADEERRRPVRDSLQTLPSDQRQAVSLHVFGGLTVREVARTMDLPRSTAHERLHKGLASLRKKLAVVSSIALLPVGKAASAEMVGWLQALPGAPVPPSLTSWVAALPASASVTGAALVAQSSGGLGEESFSHELTRGFLQLDSRTVHRRADTLRTVAGDPSAPLNARGAAAGALGQIDSAGAVRALLTGFDELPERERQDVIGYLADFVRGAEAHAALERIATKDPAPKVRSAAERAAKR